MLTAALSAPGAAIAFGAGMATLPIPEPAAEVARAAAVVINLHSRSGRAMARAAIEQLRQFGVDVRQASFVKSGPQLMKSVRAAIDAGLGTVVIGGGDGTISSVVNLLAKRPDLSLGILPVGTGNEVARTLGIPLDLEGACRVIAEGRVETVDLAEANGNYFLHTALIGYPARLNHSVPSWLKARFGKLAYTYALLGSILRAKPFWAKVTAGEEGWEGETIVVAVGNSRFHTPASVLLPRPRHGKTGLVAYAPKGGRLSTLLRLAIGLYVTRRKQPSLLFSLNSDSVTVETDPPQPLDLDGEYARPTPVHFQSAKDALRVLVPDTE